jgi:hypothetical protein
MLEVVVQVVKCLPTKHMALCSNPSTAKKKKKRRVWGCSSVMAYHDSITSITIINKIFKW